MLTPASDLRRLTIPSANLALAIAMGAFGAHTLAGRISDGALQIYKTGSSYHLLIGVAWFALALAPLPIRSWRWFAIFLGVGTVLFSGSLYALAICGIRIFGAITPLGGVCWIVGFLTIAFQAASGKLNDHTSP